MSDDLRQRVDRLERLCSRLEQDNRLLRSGVWLSHKLIIGGGHYKKRVIYFDGTGLTEATGDGDDQGSIPRIEFDPEGLGLVVVYPDGFSRAQTEWITGADVSIQGALSGVDFTLEDADGNLIPIEEAGAIIALRRQLLQPGTDFTVDGAALQMTVAPNYGPFFLVLARRQLPT